MYLKKLINRVNLEIALLKNWFNNLECHCGSLKCLENDCKEWLVHIE